MNVLSLEVIAGCLVVATVGDAAKEEVGLAGVPAVSFHVVDVLAWSCHASCLHVFLHLSVFQHVRLHVVDQGVFQGEGTRTSVVCVPCLTDSEQWFPFLYFPFFADGPSRTGLSSFRGT